MEHNDAVTGATLRKEGAQKTKPITVKIEGMTCDHCASTVAQAIFSVPGVDGVKVFLDRGNAQYASETGVNPADIAAAVEKAGYKVVE